MRAAQPDLRIGALFGGPAAFVGKRMAFCVFGDTLGVRVPAAYAERLVREGVASAFRPYRRAPMKEWVALRASPDDPRVWEPVLTVAVGHARGGAVPG